MPESPTATSMKFDTQKPLQAGMEKVRRPEVGMTVLFYEGGDTNQQGTPAIVVGVGMLSHCVDLKVVFPGHDRFVTRDAVRHAGDPKARSEEFLGNGSWEHCSWMPK